MRNHELLKDHLENAQAITWDTCHKIYVLMDVEQVEKMRGYGYDPIITADEATPKQMYTLVRKWFNDSCGLRFITSIATNYEKEDWVSIVGQGERFYA